VVLRTPGPDRLEQGIRIGCGALFGLLLFGLFVAFLQRRLLRPLEVGWLGWVAIPLGSAVFAFLAWRYGDRFWSWWGSTSKRRWRP
jgi:hypothetical protein